MKYVFIAILGFLVSHAAFADNTQPGALTPEELAQLCGQNNAGHAARGVAGAPGQPGAPAPSATGAQ